MTLARLGTTSLFLGVWTPLVALAIVWATAGSGTPIVFALEQAGVDQIDRTAVALVFAPPLPYLMALAALTLGLAVQRFTPDNSRALQIRRTAIQLWIAGGLSVCAAAPLSLYAEHGTSHEPHDEVHLALLIAAWIWWSITATAISVAIVLRTHVALARWASRSRPVAGMSVGFGIVSLTAASIAVAPAPARAALVEWAPPIAAIATRSESLVLALAGTSAATSSGSEDTRSTSGGSGDDDATVKECLEQLGTRYGATNAIEDAHDLVRRRHPSVDAEDVAIEAALEVCLKRRDGNVRGLLKVVAERRAIDRLRSRSTLARNETSVARLLATRVDETRRLEARAMLLCLTDDVKDEALRAAMLDPDGAAQLARLRGIATDSARRTIARAWDDAVTRASECAPELLH